MATEDNYYDDSAPSVPDLNDSDMDNLVRTMYAEAGNQGDQGLAAVASVIKNRLASGNYGNSATDVITQPKQFSSWNSGTPKAPPQDVYDHLQDLAQDVWSGDYADPTNGATHYYANKGANAIDAPAWANGATNQTQIGDQLFMNAKGGGSGTQVASNSPSVPASATDATSGQGALHPDFITGGLGTLFGLSPDDSHSIGARLEGIAAAGSALNNPSGASVYENLRNQMLNTNNDWQTVGSGLMGKTGAKGILQINNKTGQYRWNPLTGAAAAAGDEDLPDLKTGDTTNEGKFVNSLTQGQNVADEALALQNELVSHPEIYKNISASTGIQNLIQNLKQQSGPLQDFGNRLDSLVGNATIATAGQPGMGTMSRTLFMQKLEKELNLPPGSKMDPTLLYSALGRIADRGQRVYTSSMIPLRAMENKFGSNLGFSVGGASSPSAYDNTVQQNWQQLRQSADQGYQAMKKWHDAPNDTVNPALAYAQRKFGTPGANAPAPAPQAPPPYPFSGPAVPLSQ